MIGLDQTATVLTRSGTTGQFTVTATAGLRVRLSPVGLGISEAPGPATSERLEADAQRLLLWDAAYSLPSEHVRLVVDGETWQVVAGTAAAIRGPSSATVYRRCRVVRVA